MAFTLEDAQVLIPEVRERTTRAATEMEKLLAHASELPEDTKERDDIGEKIRVVVEGWAADINKLGAEVKGLWLVDFDSGDGYWCWKHPEETLEYFHGYEEGFSGRKLIPAPVLH